MGRKIKESSNKEIGALLRQARKFFTPEIVFLSTKNIKDKLCTALLTYLWARGARGVGRVRPLGKRNELARRRREIYAGNRCSFDHS